MVRDYSLWVTLAVSCLATIAAADTTDTCSLPPVAGPCEAYMPRFYFDPAQQKCRCFVYGGCDGNSNNFATLAECVQSCGGLQSRCLLPKKVHPCRARKLRFYYNSEEGRCQSFFYGGCRGNSNNFQSLAACQASCPDPCDSTIPPPPPPLPTCPNNVEPEKVNGKPKMCGRGGQECSSGFHCVHDPADRGAICCPDQPTVLTCPSGKPETENGTEVFCGRGGRSCSPGYNCLVHPTDRGAICCPVEQSPVLTCPNGKPEMREGKEVFCGRGGRACSPGYKCLVHPADKGAICCPEAKCRSDEEYSDCGSKCAEQCRRKGEVVACPFLCESGCFCKRGLLRHKDGRCVPQDQCHAEACGENEEYSECGSPCGQNCSELGKPPKVCAAVCIRGCSCKAGYLRNDQGRCVPKDQCDEVPPSCGEHEVYKPCGNKCLNTCFPRHIAVECPNVCQPGCVCDREKGYVQHFSTKKCITIEQCLKEQKCGMLEEYRKCGSRCWEKCYPPTVDPLCPEECEEGCFCKKGYVRNKEGNCISAQQCVDSFNKCGENELLSPEETCENNCTETCKARTTGAVCTKECGKGCFCAKGFGRDSSGKCVPLDQCSSGCGENEELKGCYSACTDSCQYRTGQWFCPMGCLGVGCGCKTGWARGEGGKCVPIEQCPRDRQK